MTEICNNCGAEIPFGTWTLCPECGAATHIKRKPNGRVGKKIYHHPNSAKALELRNRQL